MSIATSCPACGQAYNLADSQWGKTVECRRCREPFRVGEEERPAPWRDEEERDRPRERRPRSDPYERPRRRARGPMVPLIVWLLLGGGLAIVCLTGLVIGILYLGPFGNRVTVENFRKLEPGMSEAEVTAILGVGTDVTQEMFDEAGRKAGMPELARMLHDGRTKVLKWESGKDRILLTLRDGKVLGIHGTFAGWGKR